MFSKLLNSKFKKDLSFSYLVQAIIVSFGFFQLFLINRYFGINTFGQLAIIISTVGIFSSILTARSSEAVTRFFKREELSKNYENAKFVLFIGFSIDFITAMLLFILVYFLSHFIATTFLKDVSFQDEIIIYSFITFFRFLRGSMIGYMQSKEMFVKINTINILESFIKIIGLIISIFIFHKLFLVDIIYSFLVASIITFFYTFYIFIKSYVLEFKGIVLKINKTIFKEYWTFNLKTFISSALKIGATNIDNLILGYYSTTETVGIYQTIKKLLSPLSFIIAPFTSLTLSKIIDYYENKQYILLHNLIKSITIKLFFVSIGMLVLLFFTLPYFLFLQNIEYNYMLVSSFFILSFYYILPLFIWWGRNFIILYDPTLAIYSNLLLSVNSIWIPILLYKLNYFDGLITISIGVLLAYIPSWLFAPIIYIKFMKKQRII